jgi:hypothetical protein
VKDQYGGRDKPKAQLPLPIVICLFLLLGSLQVLGEEETWLGCDNFPISEKVQSLYNTCQILVQVQEGEVRLECRGLNPMYFIVSQSTHFFATQEHAHACEKLS